ncbi:MAG: carbohydrate kinase family protein [Candidatus Limnocylindrales bacterium]
MRYDTSAVVRTAARYTLGPRSPGGRVLRLRTQPKLACLGDLTMDIVVGAQSAAVPGTDVPGTIRFRAGGSAANTARAFAALGGDASFIGAVGSDELGGRLIAALRAYGVTVHAVRVRGLSARLVALLSNDGERSFITDRGVAEALPADAVKDSWISRIDALHVPAYSLIGGPLAAASIAAIHRARDGGALISIDLASACPLLSRGRRAASHLIRSAAPDILFANATEAAALVGPSSVSKLLDFAPIAVVKQGSGGGRVLWSGERGGEALQAMVATKPLSAADTTGAGDAFDAGFLHSLIASGYRRGAQRNATVLRRAALAGHRAAARLLSGTRKELLT